MMVEHEIGVFFLSYYQNKHNIVWEANPISRSLAPLSGPTGSSITKTNGALATPAQTTGAPLIPLETQPTKPSAPVSSTRR